MLEVIQQQQQPARGELLRQILEQRASRPFSDPQRVGYRLRHERRVAHCRERHQDRAIGKGGLQVRGNLQGKPGFADAPGAGQGQQADIRPAQQFHERGNLHAAADKRHARRRQRAGMGLPRGAVLLRAAASSCAA